MPIGRLSRRDLLKSGVATGSWPAFGSLLQASSRKYAPATHPVVERLISRMTLEEKLGQLVQARGERNNTGPYAPPGSEADVRAGKIGSFLGVYGAETTRKLQRIAVEETRLGIPLLFAEDVIHGFRTIFPVPIAEAASFDIDAARQSARISAIEASASGVHWTFAPMVDMTRDPRWGRIVEGAGEDVYLACLLASARVRGFQGESLSDPDALLATAKHFVAYGAAEGGRDYAAADVSERSLHEYYLPPFRAAVAAGVAAVMAGFNELNGVPMHANRSLIEGLLRGEWHFDGLVVSDYTGIRELVAHGSVANDRDAGVKALRAGIDVDMVSAIYSSELPAAVRSGQIQMDSVNSAVRRLLNAKAALGLFENPYRNCEEQREKTQILTSAHRAAARACARKSFVLLKNERNVLPLSRDLPRIAVLGPLADDRRSMLGSWAPTGVAADAITVTQGVEALLGADRVMRPSGPSIPDAEIAANSADGLLLCLGEDWDMSGEARSRSSLDLASDQQALAEAMIATGKPVIVLLFTGRPLSIGWLADHADAILLVWYPGIEAGHAIADVLFGGVSPSGRLPVTFPRTVGQVPIHYDHKNTGRPPRAAVQNTSKYIDAPWTPLYPFGFGLTYSRISYRELRPATAEIALGETLSIMIEVANDGAFPVEEVVQLYLHDDVASVTRPVRMLRRFERVALGPGEARQIHFTLEPEDFSFVGLDMRTRSEPGTFTLYAGGSSDASLEARVALRDGPAAIAVLP